MSYQKCLQCYCKKAILFSVPLLFIIQSMFLIFFFCLSSALLVSIPSGEDAMRNAADKLRDSYKSVMCIGLPDDECNVPDIPMVSSNDAFFYVIWLNLFGFLWSNEFVDGVSN